MLEKLNVNQKGMWFGRDRIGNTENNFDHHMNEREEEQRQRIVSLIEEKSGESGVERSGCITWVPSYVGQIIQHLSGCLSHM